MPASAMLGPMNALKAHVKNGQIVLDAPADLAEGAELLVFPLTDDMTDEERTELEHAVERGAEDFERGEFLTETGTDG